MDGIRDSFSRLGRKLKNPFKRRRHKRDGTGADIRGERVNSSDSLPQQEPHVDQEGAGSNTDGLWVYSTDRPPQPGSDPVPARGSRDNRERREANDDVKELSQRSSHLHPDVKTPVGSGRSREAERVRPSPSTPSIPHSGKSTCT